MTAADLQALLPLLILGATSLFILLGAAFLPGHRTAYLITIVGMLAALASIRAAVAQAPHLVGEMLVIDAFALFYIGLLLLAALVVTTFAYDYLKKIHLKAEEFYALLTLATLGGCVLAASNHFATMFLGIELLSVPLYVLIAYVFRKNDSLEAALKYLILAATASAFLLFGMALIYAELGTMHFDGLRDNLQAGIGERRGLLLAGIALMITGFGFKLAVAPFHMWTPDIYQGAPAPVTAFIATISKGAMVALLLRFFGAIPSDQIGAVFTAISCITVASMTIGNLLALRQTNVKRIMAYSSIAHLGYVLVAFLSGGPQAIESATFYIVSYSIATLSVFGLLAALSNADGEPETLAPFKGLFWRNRSAAVFLSLAIFSLIGIPLTSGFWAKLFIFIAGIQSGLWVLVILLALNSAIGLYYYLRILFVLYSPTDELSELSSTTSPLNRSSFVILAALTLLSLTIGIHPAPLLELVKMLVTTL